MESSVQLVQKDGWDYLTYIGPINEEAEVHLNEVLKKLGPKVHVNFRQVSNVNSCGVRSWINFMREASKGREVVFHECTTEIVTQINMIPSFKGQAKIQSVFASYACPSCSHQTNVLFEKGKNLPESAEDPIAEQACPKCGTTMEMEELEEEFFAFVA